MNKNYGSIVWLGKIETKDSKYLRIRLINVLNFVVHRKKTLPITFLLYVQFIQM